MRDFGTGATRNDDKAKFDYEGFYSPEVMYAFGEYMHSHRKQKDGNVRDSDNWQKGISRKAYRKSLIRHTMDAWRLWRGGKPTNPDTGEPVTMKEALCGVIFNAQGLLHEELLGRDVGIQPVEEVSP